MWWNKYVGLPFVPLGRDRTGCDCLGLVRLGLAENFGVHIPSHDEYEDPCKRSEVGPLFTQGKASWALVTPGKEKAGDVVLLTRGGVPCHVGLVILPGLMLHVMQGIEASIESYNAPLWRQRIEGIYRHADLA